MENPDTFTVDVGQYIDTEPFLHLSPEEKDKVNKEAVDNISGLTLYPDFITPEEEKKLWDFLLPFEFPRTIARRSRIGNTGPFSQFLIDRLKEKAGIVAERCYVNLYQPGDNIGAHFDSFATISDRVTVISLGDTSVVQMTDLRNMKKYHVIAEPRSMYSMTGDSRYEFFHALPYRVKKQRMSIVFTSSSCFGSWTTLDSEKIITPQMLMELAVEAQTTLGIDMKHITLACDLGTSDIMPHFPVFYNFRYIKFETRDEFAKAVLAVQPIVNLIYDKYHGKMTEVPYEEVLELWEKHVLSDLSLFKNNQLPPPIPNLQWNAIKKARVQAVNY